MTNNLNDLFKILDMKAEKVGIYDNSYYLSEYKKIIHNRNNVKHHLIEGENLYVLRYLLKDYRNKVDLIYIDPPYNTGNHRFLYVDNFKRSGDKHSQWLKFMKDRLILARELLKEEGLIFISIDDRELAYLKILCDFIFGESNFLANFCWVMTTTNIDELTADKEIPTVGSNLGNIKKSHEYILCYRKTKKGKFNLLKSTNEYIHSRITNAANKKTILKIKKGILCETNLTKTYYGQIGGNSEPILIKNKEGMIIKNGVLQNDVILEANFRNPLYIQKFFQGERVFDKKGQEIVEVYLRKSGIPYTKKKRKGNIPNSVLSGFGDTAKSRRHLINIIGNANFPYPKPVSLLEKIIQIGTNKDNSIILDFFAGSGTTGEAVLSLNKINNTKNQFILVTNNENNICEQITYPRLENIINGYTITSSGRKVEGYQENLIYSKLEVNKY